MIVLALDTALAACQVAVCDGDEVLAVRTEPMTRGHQERLAPLVAETMAAAGLAFAQIDRIAVTVGPGSFTGLRVGLAFAKGLSLALARPAVGVGTLEALAAGAASQGLVVAVVDARRDQLYLQAFVDRAPVTAPDRLDVGLAAARLVEFCDSGPATLVGPGASLLVGAMPGARLDARPAPDPAVLARLAAARPVSGAAPRPLYLRPPEARTLAERAGLQ